MGLFPNPHAIRYYVMHKVKGHWQVLFTGKCDPTKPYFNFKGHAYHIDPAKVMEDSGGHSSLQYDFGVFEPLEKTEKGIEHDPTYLAPQGSEDSYLTLDRGVLKGALAAIHAAGPTALLLIVAFAALTGFAGYFAGAVEPPCAFSHSCPYGVATTIFGNRTVTVPQLQTVPRFVTSTTTITTAALSTTSMLSTSTMTTTTSTTSTTTVGTATSSTSSTTSSSTSTTTSGLIGDFGFLFAVGTGPNITLAHGYGSYPLFNITVTSLGTPQVNMTGQWLNTPSNVTFHFVPPVVYPNPLGTPAPLIFVIGPNAVAGTYRLQVIGNSGPYTHSFIVTLKIT
jgi:hypothetical protein